ncbi:MAG: hypothetical protein AB7H92_16880 [Microbacteriaceae bacterium]
MLRLLEVIRCEEPNDWEEPDDDFEHWEGAAPSSGSLGVEPTPEGTWSPQHRSLEPLARVAS